MQVPYQLAVGACTSVCVCVCVSTFRFLTNWSIMFYALASFLAAVNTLRFILQTRRRRVPHGPQLATSSYTDAVAAHHGGKAVCM